MPVGEPIVYSSQRDRQLAPLLHFGFLLVGMVQTLLGPILPMLAARWRLDDAQAGSLFIAQFTGAMIGSALSSPMTATLEILGNRAVNVRLSRSKVARTSCSSDAETMAFWTCGCRDRARDSGLICKANIPPAATIARAVPCRSTRVSIPIFSGSGVRSYCSEEASVRLRLLHSTISCRIGWHAETA